MGSWLRRSNYLASKLHSTKQIWWMVTQGMKIISRRNSVKSFFLPYNETFSVHFGDARELIDDKLSFKSPRHILVVIFYSISTATIAHLRNMIYWCNFSYDFHTCDNETINQRWCERWSTVWAFSGEVVEFNSLSMVLICGCDYTNCSCHKSDN